MLFNLLTSTTGSDAGNPWGSYLTFGIIAAILIVFMVLNRRTQQKRQEETKSMLDAIQPGNKVKTIGGICGVVVEVCPEENTFVLETGTEKSGKSYIKFDKQAVYQTDAVANKTVAPVEEAPVEEVVAEEFSTEVEEVVPAEETTDEE